MDVWAAIRRGVDWCNSIKKRGYRNKEAVMLLYRRNNNNIKNNNFKII
jgi:hypothetical protein